MSTPPRYGFLTHGYWDAEKIEISSFTFRPFPDSLLPLCFSFLYWSSLQVLVLHFPQGQKLNEDLEEVVELFQSEDAEIATRLSRPAFIEPSSQFRTFISLFPTISTLFLLDAWSDGFKHVAHDDGFYSFTYHALVHH